MALKLTKIFELNSKLNSSTNFQVINSGSINLDCYVKINSINGTKEFLRMDINFLDLETKSKIYDTKTYCFTPSVDTNSTNFIKQGYEYLKTLDEYKSVVDLLDE